MGDRTGGAQPGVFEEAIRRVNLLHPQFVISVGDLIEGYTNDPATLEAQWTEFAGILKGLDVPYFHVPGNHDISNPWMEREWRTRLGRPYYHFLYQGALFLVLHTEEGGVSGIGEEQAAYFRKVLAEHPAVRWTFVFMHRPLWFENDPQGFSPIAEALAGRDFTLFSGHLHNYFFTARKGAKHFILGTTGGGSPLRGPAYGEFNHVTHVTLTATGPRILHLRLDGLIDEDVVNDRTYPLVETLREGGFFALGPVVAPSGDVQRIQSTLTLANPTGTPLEVTGTLPAPPRGWNLGPTTVSMVVPPQSEKRVPVILEQVAPDALKLSEWPPITVTLTGSFQTDAGVLALPASHPWTIDWRRRLPRFPTEVTVDGVIGGRNPVAWIPLIPAGYVKERWDWHGEKDSRMDFAIWETPKELVFVGRVVDDHWLFADPNLRDQWWLWLQSGDAGSIARIHLAPKEARSHPLELEDAPPGTSAQALFEGQRMTLEVRIPKASVGLADDRVRLRVNVIYMDHDRSGNEKPSVLYWKPPWGGEMDYDASGVFLRGAAEDGRKAGNHD